MGNNCNIIKKFSNVLKKSIRATNYQTSNIKKVFIELRQTFVQALILHYFDLRYHIDIKIYVSKYAINRILG